MTKTKHLDAWLAQEQTIRAVIDASAGPGMVTPCFKARRAWRT
jgi:hypothetical protein